MNTTLAALVWKPPSYFRSWQDSINQHPVVSALLETKALLGSNHAHHLSSVYRCSLDAIKDLLWELNHMAHKDQSTHCRAHYRQLGHPVFMGIIIAIREETQSCLRKYNCWYKRNTLHMSRPVETWYHLNWEHSSTSNYSNLKFNIYKNNTSILNRKI